MKPPLSEADRIYDLGQAAALRVTDAVIAELERTTNTEFPGDLGLDNLWEEICAQVQGEQSFHWDLFDQHVRELIERCVVKLPKDERRALWLLTDEGEKWGSDNDVVHGECPAGNEDIAGYLVNCIYGEASNYINPRIREYLEGMGYL